MTTERLAGSDVDRWRGDMQRGLALSASGAWPDAAEAFRSALRVIMGSADSGALEAQAQVATLLAQASRRTGRLDDAVHFAQQAYVVSAAVLGEDAPGVVRSQTDLAIMLTAAGRHEEALALLEHIVSRLDDAGVLDVVPVGALADVCVRTSTHLRRPTLGAALLSSVRSTVMARGQSTASIDALLRHLSTQRVPQDEGATPPPSRVAGGAHGRHEDAPLQDAVHLTETLLRGTPAAVAPVTVASEVAPLLEEPVTPFAEEHSDSAPEAVSLEDTLIPPTLFAAPVGAPLLPDTERFEPFTPPVVQPDVIHEEPVSAPSWRADPLESAPQIAPTWEDPSPVPAAWEPELVDAAREPEPAAGTTEPPPPVDATDAAPTDDPSTPSEPSALPINDYEALVSGMVRERPYTPAGPRRPPLRAIMQDDPPSRTWLWVLLTVLCAGAFAVTVWLIRTGRVTLPTL